jgi:hypothetical protein
MMLLQMALVLRRTRRLLVTNVRAFALALSSLFCCQGVFVLVAAANFLFIADLNHTADIQIHGWGPTLEVRLKWHDSR